jgi:hypothetical protein
MTTEGQKKIDIQSLQEKAMNSQDEESFNVLRKSQNCRIGVGVRRESANRLVFFLEVLINMCIVGCTLDLKRMERNLILLKELKNMGYSLACEENGCISCEIAVAPQDLAREYTKIDSITWGFLSNNVEWSKNR